MKLSTYKLLEIVRLFGNTSNFACVGRHEQRQRGILPSGQVSGPLHPARRRHGLPHQPAGPLQPGKFFFYGQGAHK